MTTRPIRFSFAVSLALLIGFGPGRFALADGIQFDRQGLPTTAHTVLKLTPEQRRVARPIVSAPPWRPGLPELKKTFLELTHSQIERVRRETGLTVPRVEVRARQEFEGNCTCEDVQTAVIYADRVAVLHHFLIPGVVTPRSLP